MRIRGSGRDIIDPFESIIENTYAIIEAAEKNAVGKALVDLAETKEGSGWLIEELPERKKAVKLSTDQINKAFLESLGTIDPATKQVIEDAIKAGNADEMVTFWQQSSLIDKENEIAVFQKGTRKVYQVDPELAEVMNGLRAEQIPFLFKLIAMPARLLRAGATLTPDFMVRNIIRDAVSSGVLSRSGFIPGLDTAKGLKSAVAKDSVYWDWVKAGGDQASVISIDRVDLHKKVDDLAATGYLNRVWNVIKSPTELLKLPIELLRSGSEFSEKMTRLGEFKKATKIHGTDKKGLIQSAYESRDLMDFSRRGRLTGTFNIMTAFFNASMQGLDRTARGIKENPKRFALRAAMIIGIPSIINAIRNYNDEDIKEIPRAQRDMFWCTAVGEGKNKVIIRIPKPFELGILFGSTLERATEFILDSCTSKYGSTKKALEETFRGLGASIADVTLPNAVPTAFAPLLEQWANRSLPFDRPIVPANRTSLLPEYQYKNQTNELTKLLSHAIGTLPVVGEMNTFRPAVAENWVRGWTGGLGQYTLQLADLIGRKSGVVPDPVKPTPTLAENPFIRAFLIRHPSMGTESIQRFMDSFEQANSYLQTINSLQKDFKYEEIANLLPYSAYEAIKKPKESLDNISKTIDIIYKAPGLTADDKRELIDSLYVQANSIAKLGLKAFEDLKPTIEELKERSERMERGRVSTVTR